MNLNTLQAELRKCCAVPYEWRAVQYNTADRLTRFIYHTPRYDDVACQIAALPVELQSYARARWLNHWSSKGVEAIFAEHPRVKPNPDIYHKTIDFWIDGIPFDHKTTVFPRGYPGGVEQAIAQPRTMIDWLYANQSSGQRQHYANRLFLVLYSDTGEHWRLKAEIVAMRDDIHAYLDDFESWQLHTLPNESKADCIWFLQPEVSR